MSHALLVRLKGRLAARRRIGTLVAELGRHLGPAARDPQNLAERPCPVCGPGAEVEPAPRVVGPVYAFHRCRGCTLLFAPPGAPPARAPGRGRKIRAGRAVKNL